MSADLIATAIPAAIFLVAATVTPGPNNIVIASTVVSHGYARALPYILGVITGFPLMVALMGLGVHQVFVAVPELKRAFEIAALCMLLWMSWKVATAPVDPSAPEGARATPPGYLFSVMFQWINPKAWTVGLSLIAIYHDPEDGFLSAPMLALLLVSVMTSVLSTHVWAGFGALLSRLMNRPKAIRAFNWSMGVLLAGSSVAIFSA